MASPYYQRVLATTRIATAVNAPSYPEIIGGSSSTRLCGLPWKLEREAQTACGESYLPRAVVLLGVVIC
jgi:hypothetical protein